MADAIPQSNPWQSIGPKLGTDHSGISHIRPSDAQFGRAAVGPDSLGRQSSIRGSAMRRAKSVKKAPAAKMHKFMHRLSWNQRVEEYVFSKAQLQRQPSFVVTPDISTYSYQFKNCDLAKRKPHARFSRTSRPIAAWKNSRPMDVLNNSGQADIAPILKLTGASNATHVQKPSNETIVSALSITPLIPFVESPGPIGLPASGEGLNDDQDIRSNDSVLPRPGTDVNKESAAMKPDTTKKEIKKIQLPVKAHHSSLSCDANRHSEPLGDSTHQSRGSWLDTIPQTPLTESMRRRSDPFAGDRFRPASSHLGTSQNSRSRVLDATLIEALGSDNADIIPDQQTPSIPPQSASRVMARTANVSSPQSLTSAKSSYRPESWRRSAIIARGGLDFVVADASFEESENDKNDLTEVWSRYLRRAVAQRVMESKDRKSWEFKNELRWSKNLQWESEAELESSDGQSSYEERRNDDTESDSYSVTTSGSESTRSDGSSPKRSDGLSSNSSSRTRTPSPTLSSSSGSKDNQSSQTPKKHQPDSKESGPRAVSKHKNSQRLSQVMSPTASSPGRGSTSRLAPLHSPRQLASSSLVALASMEKVTFGDVLDRVPGKSTTHFTEKSIAWQPETLSITGDVCSTSSSSEFNEEDYVFPTQQDHRISLHTEHVHRCEHVPAVVRNCEVLKMFDHPGSSNPSIQSQVTLSSLVQTPESKEIDFDFSDQNSTRKRAHPVSPVASSVQGVNTNNAGSLQSFHSAYTPGTKLPNILDSSDFQGISNREALATPVRGSREFGSATSLGSTPEHIEAASQLVRSQSQWNKKMPDSKRVRVSHSREHLLHSRQKTMESLWGREEDDSDNGQLT